MNSKGGKDTAPMASVVKIQAKSSNVGDTTLQDQQPRPCHQDLPARDPIQPHDDRAEVDVLREENAQLRELVIHLSKLVIRNVVDPE